MCPSMPFRYTMAGHSMEARICAVICLLMSWFNVNMAIQLFEASWNTFSPERVVEVGTFILTNAVKFLDRGDLNDLPRPGRHQIVTDEVAKMCAEAFKDGYYIVTGIDEEGKIAGWDHKFFVSMSDATSHCPTIRSTLATYNVSSDYLLRRMHQVDKRLKHIKLDYKEELNDLQIKSRRTAALDMLDKIEKDPTILERICWVDEWHCWCTPKDASTRVWADAHDQRARMVLPIPQLPAGHRPIVIRCVAVVNARLGPIHMEFTTGTTDLERTLVHRDDKNFPYLVSANQMLLCMSALVHFGTPSSAWHCLQYISCPAP